MSLVFLILTRNQYIYYPINWIVKYNYLVGLGISAIIAAISFNLVKQIRLINKRRTNVITKVLKETGWDNYINSLKATILKNSSYFESFTLGIIGSWGSGKTTFLKILEDQLTNDSFIVKFNPWTSNNEKQITNDFFNTLISDLSPYYSDLSTPIKKYSDILIDLDVNKNLTKVSKLISKNFDNSLNHLKLEVEKCLQHFEKPIIVIIDDIDRLNADEILEVFKLIRNSACFKNIIYIIAYDKTYINRTLTKKGITTPDLFIEKLFSLEILLPQFEQDIILSKLYELVCESNNTLKGTNKKIIQKLIYKKNIENDSYFILKYIRTFRSIERFSLQFNQNIEVILNNNILDQVKISDFFWLELLQYTDLETYNSLSQETHKNIELKDGKYLFITTDEQNKNNSSELLKILFDYNNTWNSMNNLEFYHQYFFYRLHSNKISMADFRSAIKTSKEASIALIEKNIEDKKESLKNIFEKALSETNLEFSILINLFHSLFSFYLKLPTKETKKLLLQVLSSSISKDLLLEKKEEFKTEVIKTIKEEIDKNNTDQLQIISHLLTYLHGKLQEHPTEDFWEIRTENLIILNAEICELASYNFQHFISTSTIKNDNFFIEGTYENNFLNSNIQSYSYSMYFPDSTEEIRYDKYLLIRRDMQNILNQLNENGVNNLIAQYFNFNYEDTSDYYYDQLEIEELINRVKINILMFFDGTNHYITYIKNKSNKTDSLLLEYFTRIGLKKEYIALAN